MSDRLPAWDKAGGRLDMYYWYFGTLAAFQVGGQLGRDWMEAMKKEVLPAQQRTGHAKGSWDPAGVRGREGGRVGATALMTMCFEVSYRYPRLFHVGWYGGRKR